MHFVAPALFIPAPMALWRHLGTCDMAALQKRDVHVWDLSGPSIPTGSDNGQTGHEG